MQKKLVILGLGLVAALGGALGSTAALAAETAPAGTIAYQSLRDGRWRIVVMNSDRTGKVKLPGQGNNTLPVWLPDGRILFNSDRSGNWKIYTMAADGSDVRLETGSGKSEQHAGVTADGRLLLVRRGLRSYLVRDRVAGVNKPLSFSSFPGTGGEIVPTLSPDGTKVAFLFKSGSGAARAVYAAAVTETETSFKVGPATKVAVGCFSAWMADSSGFLMCMIKNGSAGGSDLYRVEERLDGTWSKTRVTTKIDWDYFPAWSPDNSWIVWGISPVQYHDYENPTYEIWAMPAAGGTPVRLTKDGYADNFPSWGPPRGL